MMNARLLIATLALSLTATSAQAVCYADYKAKQDNPLKLHYGVIELPDRVCGSPEDVERVVARRIGVDGWTLLNEKGIVVSNNTAFGGRAQSLAGVSTCLSSWIASATTWALASPAAMMTAPHAGL